MTSVQLEKLVFMICRLWTAFNFTALIPEEAPAEIVYSILVREMLKSRMVMDYGNQGIEFCDYEPELCPFGKKYCSCKDI